MRRERCQIGLLEVRGRWEGEHEGEKGLACATCVGVGRVAGAGAESLQAMNSHTVSPPNPHDNTPNSDDVCLRRTYAYERHEPCDYTAPYAYNASAETSAIYGAIEQAYKTMPDKIKVSAVHVHIF